MVNQRQIPKQSPKIFEFRSNSVSSHRTNKYVSQELSFNQFNNSVKLVTPLDILMQIMPSV